MEWYHILGIIIPIGGMFWAVRREIQKETKDFHGRLCKLEEKYQGIRREKL